MSDIHTEFKQFPFEYNQQPDDKDTTLILAGDIGTKGSQYPFIEKMSELFKRVIYVTGNHEYYYSTIKKINIEIPEKIKHLNNVYFLNPGSLKIDNLLFLGGTLWTGGGGDDYLDHYYSRGMNDFRGIIVDFSCKNAKAIHHETLDYFEHMISGNPDKDIIMITHHAPSELSTLECYKGSGLSRFFFSNLENWILDRPNIKFWVHGHCHNSSDYMIGDTRVLCNPFGYSGYEVNWSFNEGKFFLTT